MFSTQLCPPPESLRVPVWNWPLPVWEMSARDPTKATKWWTDQHRQQTQENPYIVNVALLSPLKIFYKSIFNYGQVLLNCCFSNKSHSFCFPLKYKAQMQIFDSSVGNERSFQRTIGYNRHLFAASESSPVRSRLSANFDLSLSTHPPLLCLLLPPCLVSCECLLKEIIHSCRLARWGTNSLIYALRDVQVFPVAGDRICNVIEQCLWIMTQSRNIRKMDVNRAAQYHPHRSH